MKDSVCDTRVLRDVEDFRALREEWDALLEASPIDTRFFLRWSWVAAWWETYAPPGARMHLVTCRIGEGRLVGLAPLYMHTRRFHGIPHVREIAFLGTGVRVKTSEYLDVICAPGFESSVAQAIAAELERNRWDRLWLWNIPDSSPCLEALRSALGPQARLAACDVLPYVNTSRDWKAVSTELGSGFRKKVDYYPRRLFREHACEFARVASRVALDPAIEDFIRLHEARWRSKGEPGSFAGGDFEPFMRRTIHASFEEGRLLFWRLTSDGRCVATLLAFADNGIAHYFQGGIDPSYGKYDLGVVMIRLCVEDCIADPSVRQFDFMGGGAAYKMQWTPLARKAVEIERFRAGPRSWAFRGGWKARRLAGHAWRALRTWQARRKATGAAGPSA